MAIQAALVIPSASVAIPSPHGALLIPTQMTQPAMYTSAGAFSTSAGALSTSADLVPARIGKSSVFSAQQGAASSRRTVASRPPVGGPTLGACGEERRLTRVGLTAEAPGRLNAGTSSFYTGARGAYQELAFASLGGSPSLGESAGGADGGHAGMGGVQMSGNWISRLFRVVRASIESFVSGTEDPEKIIDQAVLDMGVDLAKLRSTTAQVLAAKKLMEDRLRRAEAGSEDWYRRARRALELGNESLAREALSRRKSFQDSANSLRAQLQQQRALTEKMQTSMAALEAKMMEAKSKKDTLKARAQTAKTSKWVAEMVGSIDVSSALAAYERMEEKVLQLEAEADSVLQIGSDSLETKFAELEAGDVDDDLAALRREMTGGKAWKPPAALPSSSSSRMWDPELLELRRDIASGRSGYKE